MRFSLASPTSLVLEFEMDSNGRKRRSESSISSVFLCLLCPRKRPLRW